MGVVTKPPACRSAASLPPGFSRETVRSHYRDLSSTYEVRSNRVCEEAYRDLARRACGGAEGVLEVGCGAARIGRSLGAKTYVGIDLSPEMLARNSVGDAAIADAARIPFASDSFDFTFSINLLEHVPEPQEAVAEQMRVLKPGGRCLAVTPNGDVEWLLDAIEMVGGKIPEGPHRYIGREELRDHFAASFEVVECSTFLSCPGGPRLLRRAADRWLGRVAGFGLFQFALGIRRA